MQVKCTSCGAQQNISEAKNCDFCGNLIELESATNNYKTALSGESGNLMAMAETAIEATNWEEALQFFNQVLTKDITNSDAWLGKGIAIVYTSKIGDIKFTEAIAYWKNALKHAPNQDAMGKRVAKEINGVVNAFYPSLENHFIQFKDLDNSYGELVAKFVILEKAIDYATLLDSTNIKYCETGYALCSRVIQIPKQYALADESAAWAQGILGAVQQNKYKTQDAVRQRNKAKARQEEINKAAKLIIELETKYAKKAKQLTQNKTEPNTDPKIEQGKPIDKVQRQIIEKNNSNKTLYIVISVILLLVISGIIWFYLTNQGASKQELFAKEKIKVDSIAAFENNKAVQDSQKAQAIADSTSIYNASQESLQKQETENKDEIAAKIYNYFEDLQLDKLDASNYFASTVSEFYNKKNITPSEINNLNASGKSEFSNPQITIDVNYIVLNRSENDVSYYTFGIHFKCYRTSKQKTEECDETLEIGVNKENEFVSIKELKIENLKFYSEGDNY